MNRQVYVFCVFFLAVLLFFIGFHNIDNAWNMASDCWDTSLGGISYTRVQLYQNGIYLMFLSLIMFFICAVMNYVPRVSKPLYPNIAK